MSGLLYLSWRHVVHQRTQTAILASCLAVALFVPVTSGVLARDYERGLAARAAATPLVAGRRGNRFDLTLGVLWFRESELETTPFAEVDKIRASGLGTPIPIHVRFTAHGHPVVGTSPEYHELHGLRPASGTLPLQLGDVTLGAAVARELGLGVGEALFSDQKDIYDIAKPPALKMHVAGVLDETGGPDDHGVFVSIATCWILEGIAHGHDEPETIDASLVIGRTSDTVTFSGALVEYNEVTPDNVESFHYHGDPTALPLTAVIVVPNDEKAATLLKARWDTSEVFQIVVPTRVVGDLMAFVLRIKALFDAVAVVLGGSTLLMAGLVLGLSVRLRRGEIETLHRIGCGRNAVFWLCAFEIGVVVVIGAVTAALAFGATLALLPDLVRAL